MNPAFKDTVWAPRPACCYDPPTVVAPLTVQRGRPAAAHDSDPYDTITENMPDVDVPRFTAEAAVFRPQHYNRFVIEPVTFAMANALPFDVANVVKYVCRADAKNKREDVRKAIRYCEMILERFDREDRIAAGEHPQDVWKDTL